MATKRKLQIFFLLAILLIPNSVLAYSSKIIPGGENIGIELNSKGIMIVGFYKVDNKYLGRDAGFELGDRIIKVNNISVNSISEMIKVINTSSELETVKMTFIRNNKELFTNLTLIKDNNNIYKTGLFVKDQINGIGTLTYIDPNTHIYGALGHEIADKNSTVRIEIKDGKIFNADVTGITKSETGIPGEKNATFDSSITIGNIKKNEKSGIFGTYGVKIPIKDAIEVGKPDDVKLGNATIATVIKGSSIETFKINILKIDHTNKTKNILFEITDPNLLNKTAGIVQGMSGSPIMQDNKIVGAVTHVIVNDSKKGYGIFITTMLEEGEN
ncbi:MAG: SpoIVB peptidase [Bacilli bacterium]